MSNFMTNHAAHSTVIYCSDSDRIKEHNFSIIGNFTKKTYADCPFAKYGASKIPAGKTRR